MNFKNFSNFKSGFAALFKKTAIEFRKTIINYNELIRIYAHLVYSVKKIKILIVKSKMATVLKLSIFDFCDFWIATSDLETCMHGSNLFYPTRPGPVRSQSVQLCICYRSRPVVPNLWPAGQKWPSRLQKVALQTSKSGPRPPKEF